MYLETMQQMYAGASKVLVDTRGNGNMLYLPLDKIIQQAAQDPAKAAATPAVGTPPATTAPLTPAPASSTSRPNQSSGQLTRDRANR